MAVLAMVFTGATLAGMHEHIPAWLVWILGIVFALAVLSIGLTVIGGRLLERTKAAQDGDANDEN
ncbi:MAG: hypothetical protein K0U93_10285 [Gammaproteobacteria bacterium]|nr:hypothetical protein [Gammaproteobacteria bacterium]